MCGENSSAEGPARRAEIMPNTCYGSDAAAGPAGRDGRSRRAIQADARDGAARATRCRCRAEGPWNPQDADGVPLERCMPYLAFSLQRWIPRGNVTARQYTFGRDWLERYERTQESREEPWREPRKEPREETERIGMKLEP